MCRQIADVLVFDSETAAGDGREPSLKVWDRRT
jgi:hypothetical protein